MNIVEYNKIRNHLNTFKLLTNLATLFIALVGAIITIVFLNNAVISLVGFLLIALGFIAYFIGRSASRKKEVNFYETIFTDLVNKQYQTKDIRALGFVNCDYLVDFNYLDEVKFKDGDYYFETASFLTSNLTLYKESFIKHKKKYKKGLEPFFDGRIMRFYNKTGYEFYLNNSLNFLKVDLNQANLTLKNYVLYGENYSKDLVNALCNLGNKLNTKTSYLFTKDYIYVFMLGKFYPEPTLNKTITEEMIKSYQNKLELLMNIDSVISKYQTK